jgi:6,7-dimethyl-8-ribityllumazine synthase
MSREGAPELAPDGGSLRVAVVAASWHEQVMDGLIDGALSGLAGAGVAEPLLLRVAGTLELPVAAARCVSAGYDAVVALGVVIRGDTPHFDYVCEGAVIGLTQVSVTSGVPIGFGVLPCDHEQQALDRAGLKGSRESKGREAALAAVGAASTLRSLDAANGSSDGAGR